MKMVEWKDVALAGMLVGKKEYEMVETMAHLWAVKLGLNLEEMRVEHLVVKLEYKTVNM